MSVEETTALALVDRYSAFLLDAYGVLVDASGALPGALELVNALVSRGRPFRIVTNDASRSPEEIAKKLVALGFEVSAELIVSSGSLIASTLGAHGVSEVVVLGPEGSKELSARSGARVIEPDGARPLEALVVADEHGYPMLETLDEVISMLFSALDEGRRPLLVLSNPDLVYPKSKGRYGLTAGAVARVIEGALELRDSNLGFVKLGKPYAPIFEAALSSLGTRDAVMIGDQLLTDVRGAIGVGIDAAFVESGVARWTGRGVRPTWRIAALV
ncbi:MAG: HAD hydrolase-like protein [Deltaproteobacteria bacterium]|nr:HAD hydrolase-like protein [Deltaproteobacteria bacterium]